MALMLPLGLDDYRELKQGPYALVDKTLMLQEILADGTKAFLITRPRRFGKSLNMSMIKYFFDVRDADENRKLFAETLIAKASYKSGDQTLNCMDEQGQYPVILLSLKGLKAAQDYEGMLALIRVLMATLYGEHDYLLESGELSVANKEQFERIALSNAPDAELSYSLVALTRYLKLHYKLPVILLVDECDTPFHTAYKTEKPFYKELIDFMGTFLGEAFKGNAALKTGIMTGILRVSLMNLFSGVNNVMVRNVVDCEYSRHFGFTDTEVDDLYKQLDRKQDEAKVKKWYNGYQFGDVTIYNPWSILNCLAKNDEFRAYWIGTGEHGVLGKALISCSDLEVFEQLQQLLDGKTIEMVIDERTIFAAIHGSQRALWNLMLYSGYLTPVKRWQGDEDLDTHLEVRLPNYEVIFSIRRMVKDWISLSDSKSIHSELRNCLQSGDIQKFRDMIQRYILQTISYYDFSYDIEERFYHIFMLGILIGLGDEFIIDSNKEAGLGRYDIILIPNDKDVMGIVLELKSVSLSEVQQYEIKNDELKRLQLMEQEAEKALAQIETKAYGVRFQQHGIKQFAAIGMAFLGKEVTVRHKVIAT